jgi:hypothetical protein
MYLDLGREYMSLQAPEMLLNQWTDLGKQGGSRILSMKSERVFQSADERNY